MAIKDLQARQSKVDITVNVVEVSEPREFTKFDKPGRVATAIVSDSTGTAKLALWNEEIDKVKAGSKITIKNGYVNEYKGELQLTAGRFGSIEVDDAALESAGEVKREPSSKDKETNLSDDEPADDKIEDIDIEEEDVK